MWVWRIYKRSYKCSYKASYDVSDEGCFVFVVPIRVLTRVPIRGQKDAFPEVFL